MKRTQTQRIYIKGLVQNYCNSFTNVRSYNSFAPSSRYAEQEDYVGERKAPNLNCYKSFVENGSFAHHEQMLQFRQCLQ